MVRAAVRRIDPHLAIGPAVPLNEAIGLATAGAMMRLRLLMALAIGCVLIAVLGVGALTAFSVTSRHREYAIRMALGRDRVHVIGDILSTTVKTVVLGITVAVPMTLTTGAVVASSAPGTPAWDAISLGLVCLAVAGLVLLIAFATCLSTVRTDVAALFRS